MYRKEKLGLTIGATYMLLPGTYDEAETTNNPLVAAAVSTVSSAAATAGLGGLTKPKERPNFSIPTKCIVKKNSENSSVYVVEVNVNGKPKNFTAKRSQISIDRDSFDELLKKNQISLTNVTQDDITAIGNFFNPANNAVVRSFENVSGKGLACTIESVDFVWLENTTWETETYGSRAPKMCKVTLAISPIHDITPGIDSDGFNRAPVYNVGTPVNAIGGDSYDDTGKGKSAFNNRLTNLFGKTIRK
jgi:hypothetical protein